MIPAAGIGTVLLHFNDPVKDKLTAGPAIEGQVVLLELPGDRRQGNLIPAAGDEWVHTLPVNRQGKSSAVVQGLFDQRIPIRQIRLNTQDSLPLSALQQNPRSRFLRSAHLRHTRSAEPSP